MSCNQISEGLDATIIDLFDEWAERAPDRIATEWQGGTLTYAELRNSSLHVSQALLSVGVPPRAKVPLLTQMSLEMLPAVIGILRIGACYVPMDVAAWSLSKVDAALRELNSSVAIVTSSCDGLQLPAVTINFQKGWLHSSPIDTSNLVAQLDVLRAGFRADDIAWIVFTSGTTGKPKGVMVFHKAIYSLAILPGGDITKDHEEKGMRCLLAYSIAFDGCAGIVWTTLTKGGTLAMASPSTFPEIAKTCELLNMSPSMLSALDVSGQYDGVRYIVLGAEAPSLDVVRQWIHPSRKVINTYGPSETTVVVSFGEMDPKDDEALLGPILPGFRVVLVDEDLQECDYGEMMISGPGLAAGYLNNPELTAKKFIQWNGERFYRTGDLARRTVKGELVWAGRADSLIKNRGFLINLETEVEPALMSFPTVRSAVAFKWREKLVGCVQPSRVDVEELRAFLKARFDHFVVPDELLAMDSFPLNVNSKVDRRLLEAQLEEGLSQDEQSSLDLGRPISAYDALRLAFTKCLHVIFKNLDRDSSFTRLGGNSLAAIRTSNFLEKHGFRASVVQLLKLDTIKLLEDHLQSQTGADLLEQDTDDFGYDSDEAPATDVQKLFLTRSMRNPISCALIGITKYVGDSNSIPTASELHEAAIKALSAHSIYRTRFNLTSFTLEDLGRLNLDWQEVSVAEEADFDRVCQEAEEKAWTDLNYVTDAQNEIPYCHITCVSVPGRKALAFVTRMHHVLTDVFSSAIVSHDVERALAGEVIPAGSSIRDYARFMHKHKQKNLQRAIEVFEGMMKPMSATSVLQLPSPRITPPEQVFDLVCLDSPVAVSKAALNTAARRLRVTTSTMIYAAWALFHSKVTGWDRVGFSVSLSGRTIPWPSAQSIAGPLQCRAPFSTAVPRRASVHAWLTEVVHKTTLDVVEFDGLTHALPDSLMIDPRTNTTNVLSFLDVPQPSSRWSHTDRQKHNYIMDWYIFQNGEGLRTVFEYQSRQVDADWANEAAVIPGQMLERLVNATEKTLVGDLL